MLIHTCSISDLLVVEPKVFPDQRGYFFESYNKKVFNELNLNVEFVQDNLSKSSKGALRGLHFQTPPHTQGKLISVIKGSIMDVVVDLRSNSGTFGQYFSIEISEGNHKMLWIPKGFAHGFLTLEDDTIFSYKCTDFYNKESEQCLLWNDPTLNIQWGIENPILSEKDKFGKALNDFVGLF